MKSITFNILCAGRGENHWVFRQKLVKEIIKKYAPDTFGLQEVHYAWMRYLINQFKDIYDFVGVGKDDGNKKGEFSPVFYNKHKFELLEKEDFWLSETPEIASLGWDGAENRTCSYAVLKEKETEKVYAIFNTHLDHIGATAQIEGIKLILKKAEKFNDMPIIITGDFNVTPDSDVYEMMLSNGFSDARTIAKEKDNIDSFHWYGKGSKMIDFIFVKNIKSVAVAKTATDKINGRIPSDHYPVIAEIE